MSDSDIGVGTRWGSVLAEQLENTQFGIICVTKRNLSSPWMLFEVGALSKSVKKSNVCPYLLNIQAKEINGPLSQFQAVPANKEGTKKLIMTINQSIAVPMSEIRINTIFELCWPILLAEIEKVKKCIQEDPTEDQSNANEIKSLQKELQSLTDTIRQLVSLSSPLDQKGGINAQQALDKEFGALEGVWYSKQTRSHMYIRLINNQLYAPYCYSGNNQLTGIQNGWRKIGIFLYANFQWIEKHDMRGFVLYKLSAEKLEGRYWVDLSQDHQDLVTSDDWPVGGVPIVFRRIQNSNIPNWAIEYFEKEKKSKYKI